MKIKLDENLPVELASRLVALGHDADTVLDEGLKGSADPDVWQAAVDCDRFLFTQDLDFSDIRKFTPGTHPGILLVRLDSPGRLALIERLAAIVTQHDIDKWARCFVVVTDQKIRIRKPNA